MLARVHGFIDDLKGDTMNSLRNKLIASVTMLAVAAIMLTSASFAWYTVSQKGEVQEIKVELKATENIEIAKAKAKGGAEGTEPDEVDINQTGKEIYYGTTVTGAEFDLGLPATISEAIVKSPEYASDGRLGSLQVSTPSSYVAPTAGANYRDGGYYTCQCDVPAEAGGTVKVDDAVVYAVWLRSNAYETVDLSVTNAEGGALQKVSVVVVDPSTSAVYKNGDSVSLGGLNTDKYLEIVIFYDGTDLKAEDVANGLAEEEIKVTFTHDEA